nr:homeobox-leucine zipper protein ATHB-40-1 [Gleditsia microphylla]
MNRHPIETHMALFSHLYPSAFAQIIPDQQDNSKPRRRRRKNKAGDHGAVRPKKRRLSVEQINLLEQNFGDQHKLEPEKKDRLALELGLDPHQVAVWFQNRRARWKNKKLEEEYSDLKKLHQTAILEKTSLETEVLKLKEKLSEAKKEIQRLQERGDRVSSNSCSSSQSMEDVEPQFLGDIGVAGYDIYTPDTGYMNCMEWMNSYM